MPERIKEENVNIIFNLHPFDGTHWVPVIKKQCCLLIWYFWQRNTVKVSKQFC